MILNSSSLHKPVLIIAKEESTGVVRERNQASLHVLKKGSFHMDRTILAIRNLSQYAFYITTALSVLATGSLKGAFQRKNTLLKCVLKSYPVLWT